MDRKWILHWIFDLVSIDTIKKHPYFESWKNLRTEMKNFIWERKNEKETFRVEAHFSEPLKAC